MQKFLSDEEDEKSIKYLENEEDKNNESEQKFLEDLPYDNENILANSNSINTSVLSISYSNNTELRNKKKKKKRVLRTNQTINSSAINQNFTLSCSSQQNRRRRARRIANQRLSSSSEQETNNWTLSQLNNETELQEELFPLIRRRSTRQEARNAINRIFMYSIQVETEDEEFIEEEPIVKLEEISLPSENENDAFITIDEFKKKQKKENKDPSCNICAEPIAIDPVESLCCNQIIGCRKCVKLWYYTTNISNLNSRSPLSRGQTHENHKRCPFCRKEWPEKMLIKSF